MFSLQDTSWLFNDTITNYAATISINFTSNEQNFTSITFSGVGFFTVSYSGDDTIIAYRSGEGWLNANYRSIVITGGSDATQQSVINWFQTNATFQEHIYTVRETELIDIADAIRERGRYEQKLTYPVDFIAKIRNIPLPAIIASMVCSGSGSTFTRLGTDANAACIVNYQSDFFSYSQGTFIALKNGYYRVNLYGRGAYNTSGNAVSCYWQFFVNGIVVASATSGTTYRNAGATTYFYITVTAGSTISCTQRGATGQVGTTVAFQIISES